LDLYAPFAEDTLAASLDEPSSLKLTDNLPRLNGATALYPVYSAFVRAVYPEEQVLGQWETGEAEIIDGKEVYKRPEPLIVCHGTAGAYIQLISGEADIIFVAAPSENQLKQAEEAGVELMFTPIGRESFVFFVNAANPVDGLTTEEIQRIYSGEAVNWSGFGGEDLPILAYQRPADSGSQTALIDFMADVPLMAPPAENVALAMGEMMERVSAYQNYENAIGYSFLFFATEMAEANKIKLLAIDGVAPARETATDGSYPYGGDFYAVTAGTDNPNVDIFIEWMLSDQGQRLVEETGYTPVSQ
jgi:phosphate transport system substrate-binding protein